MHTDSKGRQRCRDSVQTTSSVCAADAQRAAFSPPPPPPRTHHLSPSRSQAAPARPGGGCSWLYIPTIMTAAGDASAGLRYPEPLATEVNTRAVVALGPQLRQRGVLASTLRRPGMLRRARQQLLLSFIDEQRHKSDKTVTKQERGNLYRQRGWGEQREKHVFLLRCARRHPARRRGAAERAREGAGGQRAVLRPSRPPASGHGRARARAGAAEGGERAFCKLHVVCAKGTSSKAHHQKKVCTWPKGGGRARGY